MANGTDKVKKKKKGIVQRMMFGNEDKPDLTAEQMNMSKWAMFKYLFFGRFGTMVALNLLCVLFAAPGIFVSLIFYINISLNYSYIPYSTNLGIGYPVVTNAVAQGEMAAFMYQTVEFLALVPCVAIFALGLAGNFYVLRKLLWEEPTSTFKDFFRGIKKCWLPALLIGIAMGFTIMLFVFTLGYFDVYNLPVALKTVSIIFASFLLVFMTLFTAFFMTQNAAFKMRPMALIRNSMLFVLGTNFLAIFFIGIAVAPVFLWLIPGATAICIMIYLFVGITFTTLVITLYCHSCYKKFLYDKIDTSTVYAKRPDDIYERAEEKAAKKKAPVPYKNPKKRKKSIDEGVSITPLAPTFRREDLERLEKEHEQVINESSDVYDDDLGELDDDADDVTPPDAETSETVAADVGEKERR